MYSFFLPLSLSFSLSLSLSLTHTHTHLHIHIYHFCFFLFFCHLQRAGNEAFQSGRYTEAIEHYTSALSSNVESRPFAAICLCNRAAAHQALGQIADAIADCSLAIALDGGYSKVCGLPDVVCVRLHFFLTILHFFLFLY